MARRFGDMKICLYTNTALPKRGGQEAVVDSLARHFLDLGHGVVILAPMPRRPLQVSDDRHPYPVVRHPRFFSTHLCVSWYRWFLLRLLHREAFDVVHCHGIHPPGYIAAISRDRISVPIVMTSHGDELDDVNPRLAEGRMRQRYVDALTAADGLIAISGMVADNYRRVCPGASSIARIPNGVELSETPVPASRPAGLHSEIVAGKYVFFLGRLKHRKGVDCLIRAFALVADQLPIHLVIAGEGTEERSLSALAEKLGLLDRVRFVGWVEGIVKEYLLRNAVCTVVPSRKPEAFGLVVIESYAAGRPVVASAVAGLKELIIPGETGILVEPDSVTEWAKTIRQFIEQSQWADQLGKQARHWVQSYSWKAIAKHHIEFYDSLIKSGVVRKGQTRVLGVERVER